MLPFDKSGNALPFVSIVTVVYNGLALLEKTAQSIWAMPDQRFEYIIVDGGSKDGTQDWLQNNEENIHQWISEPDKGIYDAMNKGQAMARGQYVWFLNAGDTVFHPEVLTELFAARKAPDVFYGETILVDLHFKTLGTRSELTTRKLPLRLNWQSMKWGMVVCHQSILVKRSLAPMYDLTYRCSADIEWVINSLKKSEIIHRAQKPISAYLTGGFSAQRQKECVKERWAIYKSHYGFLASAMAYTWISFRFMWHRLFGGKNY